MQKIFSGKKFYLIPTITVVYLVALIIDAPFIRGIYDMVMPSNWPYYYIPTWEKVWLPALTMGILLTLFSVGYYAIEKMSFGKKIIYFFLLAVVIFALHLSYVFFSRFGITVLFQRVVNPGMNGYFSSAIRLDTHHYLTDFPEVIEGLDQHARDHPPGSILLVKFVNEIVGKTGIGEYAIQYVPVPDGDVRVYWVQFSDDERVSAILIAFLYHFFGGVSCVMVYIIARQFYRPKTSLVLSLFVGLIPSVSFFALKFDTLYFLLFLITAYFFVRGVKSGSGRHFFLAGTFSGIGLFFSYSIIPALLVLGVYVCVSNLHNRYNLFYYGIMAIQGFLLTILVQLLVGFNALTSIIPIITNQAPRSYLPWFIYNPFDFFQYFGIPLSLLFILGCYKIIVLKKLSQVFLLNSSFVAIFIILVISGISRAEVGRIWMPLMIFPLLILGDDSKFLTFRNVLIISIFLFIQNIVMTEFWVPVW